MGVRFDAEKFTQQYGLTAGNDDHATAIAFKSQDSNYRVYIPGLNFEKSNCGTIESGSAAPDGFYVSLYQEHINGGLFDSNDSDQTRVEFDARGKITNVSHDLIVKGEAGNISASTQKKIDLTVELLGAVAAPFTEGASEALADEAISDIDEFCDVFNKVSAAIFKWSDDGGRLNFPAVICHNMNKACCSVVVF